MATQSEKAERFRAMHRGSEILVLPNAWDCASARIFEEAGFRAIATTSAGVAFTLGYADGERIPAAEMLAMVKRIVSLVRVPVSADLEAGYGDPAATAAGLIDAGAVGLNLEDGQDPPEEQVERIEIVRRVSRDLGVAVVINARTDVYLAGLGEAASRFERTCTRARAYMEAGADCVFIPGVADEETIRRFVETLRFPINILAMPGAPAARRLQELGVARLSVGSGFARAAMGCTRRLARELRESGSYEGMLQDPVSYADANRLFTR